MQTGRIQQNTIKIGNMCKIYAKIFGEIINIL